MMIIDIHFNYSKRKKEKRKKGGPEHLGPQKHPLHMSRITN